MRALTDRVARLAGESAHYCDRVAENWLALTKKKQIFRLPGN